MSALKSRWLTSELYFPYEVRRIRELVSSTVPKIIIAGPLNQVISSIPSDINLPIIGMSHAFDVNYPEVNSKARTSIERCSMIIADCRTIRDRILDEYSYSGPTEIVPYGCDFSFFNKTKITFENKLQILVTRNWTNVHNNRLILEALVSLNSKGIDFHCSFVGDGPTLEEGKDYAGDHLKESQYTFHGRLSQIEIFQLMERNWVYLSAAESDGSSVSLLESMSAGMICLVSSFPSNTEWINHQENGFIFENGKLQDLVKQLTDISKLPKTHLVKISYRSKQRVSIDGNWERNKEIFLGAITGFLKKDQT